MCPFCVTSDFGVVYDPPEVIKASGGTPKASAQTAIECAETAVGTGGASTNGRTSYPADHPRVVLVDTVHPDWHTKLDAALEAQARQANRRVIMRQVGDTLVPIGVSSSRTGETLANAVSHNARLGHNGPGGSIILHQNARVADLELDGAAPRSSSLSSNLPGPLQRGLPFSRFRNSERRHHPHIGDSLARSVMHLTPYEMEQIVLHETLRISREEAEARERAEQAEARAARTSSSVPRTPTEQRSQRSPETRRTPRLSFDLSRFRSSSEQPRARSSLDTTRAPNSPGPRRAPSRAGAVETTDVARAPSPIERAQTPNATAPSNAVPNATPGDAPSSLAPALVLQSSSPPKAPTSSAPTSTSAPRESDRTPLPAPSRSPVLARAPVSHPATPETQRVRRTSNTPVNLSKSVMDDLQQLSGNATPPTRHSPSTNPFRRRMDAAAP
ncbi:SNF1-interacting protein [Malassezia brasiliensis]|uniref:SNF1-interacting protein n=1 Tax=Malassezia brasiliensis TaxID=1821822 RepID=A0AAF0IU10_9BASI|nr:SNF1-interacting protein [Malassezia brasiliensis]